MTGPLWWNPSILFVFDNNVLVNKTGNWNPPPSLAEFSKFSQEKEEAGGPRVGHLCKLLNY